MDLLPPGSPVLPSSDVVRSLNSYKRKPPKFIHTILVQVRSIVDKKDTDKFVLLPIIVEELMTCWHLRSVGLLRHTRNVQEMTSILGQPHVNEVTLWNIFGL